MEVHIRKRNRLSASKMEYKCANQKDCETKAKLHDTNLEKVDKFNYLRSTIRENNNCESKIKKIEAGW